MKFLNSKTIEKVQKILARQPNVLTAYLFGSQKGIVREKVRYSPE